jgi:dolichyl-phosphate-mannose--protein O-mannosyl transferase
MQKNEGRIDRTIRLLVGFLALYLAINYSAWWYILAIIGLFTGIIGWCKLYELLGISTLKKSSKKKKY